MAKINIKSEKTIPFGEIIHVMEIKASIDNANTTNMIPTTLLMLQKTKFVDGRPRAFPMKT